MGFFLSTYVMILSFQEAVKARSSVRRCLGPPLKGETSKTFTLANTVTRAHTIHDHMRGYIWTQHVFMEHAGIWRNPPRRLFPVLLHRECFFFVIIINLTHSLLQLLLISLLFIMNWQSRLWHKPALRLLVSHNWAACALWHKRVCSASLSCLCFPLTPNDHHIPSLVLYLYCN